jgi:hypothetical protein
MIGDSLIDAMSLLHAEWMICAIAGAPGTRHLKRAIRREGNQR